MNPYRFSLSLRLRHPILPAAAIESALSRRAKVVHSVGEARKTPKGELLEGIYERTYCSFELSSGDDTKLNIEIARWNHELSKYKRFFEEFTHTGGEIEYFLGLFLDSDSGVTFSVTELRDIGALGITLALDIYPS